MGSHDIDLILATLAWLMGFVLLYRLSSASGKPAKTPPPSVSIVIPARNEEHNLPTLLNSINAQSVRPLEVIVVDDGSSDRTAEIGRDLCATVIPSQPLPEGWRGKTWACRQGANQARGDLLLFVDADTCFETDGLQSILGEYNGGALSVGPYHAVRNPYEQLSAFFNLIMTLATVPDGLFGQMLLVDRKSYLSVGGHETVKQCVLENFFLARRFREYGISTRSLAGKGILSFRMYPTGISDLIDGWTRGFASGAERTPRGLLILIVFWLIGMIIPLGSPHSPWAVLLYTLFAVQLAIIFRKVGRFHWYTALFYPVPLIFYFIVFTRSAFRSGKRVQWKGRAFRAA